VQSHQLGERAITSSLRAAHELALAHERRIDRRDRHAPPIPATAGDGKASVGHREPTPCKR
jgi:hypothetical protein